MNKQSIYLKETSSYDDILKNKHNKMPLFLKKMIFLYKNIFNIVTKNKYEDIEVWTLPLKENYTLNKMENVLKKNFKNYEIIYVVSDELINNKMYKILEKHNIEYIVEEKIKKILLLSILKYICNIQNKKIKDLELTILVNNPTDLNIHVIEKLAKNVKSLKIVTLNIYKFKKLEEKLYNEEGIAIQFSNSYKKSLEKSGLIINLDFSEIQINEYEIFDKAMIINCLKDNIKIKTRLFNGINVNSCDIEFKKDIINRFKQQGIYESYSRLLLYASIIEKENYLKIEEQLEKDNVNIISLKGSNGTINKREFKNIEKSLTKVKKKSKI